MATMMKRMVWASRDTWHQVPDEAPIPSPPPQGALIKVRWAGICHSDLFMAKDDLFPFLKLPMVFGHEICGTVEKFGSQVNSEDVSVEEADSVIVHAIPGCGSCDMCRGGSQFCEAKPPIMYGISRHGGFAQYMVVDDARWLLKVPEELPLDLACLLPCSGLTSYSALQTVRPSLDHHFSATGSATLCIIGAGGLGLWTLHLARNMWGPQLKICMADISEEKLETARREGADFTVLWGTKGDADEFSKKTTDACGALVNGCIDLVASEQTFSTALDILNKNGTLVVVGINHHAHTPSFPMRLFSRKCLRIIGILMGNFTQLQELLTMVTRDKISGPPISHVGLGDINAVFEKMLACKLEGRAVIDMENYTRTKL